MVPSFRSFRNEEQPTTGAPSPISTPLMRSLPNPAPINTASYCSEIPPIISSNVTLRLYVMWIRSAGSSPKSSAITSMLMREPGISRDTTPAALESASRTSASYPRAANEAAHARPAGPAPITATFFPFNGANTGRYCPFAQANFCKSRIWTGVPQRFLVQFFWHRFSLGQRLAHMPPKGLASLITRFALFTSP